MDNKFRLKLLVVMTFCLYLFWGLFGIDQTISHNEVRFPLHRLFIGLTALVFLCNIKVVLLECARNKTLTTLILFEGVSAVWANDPELLLKYFIFLVASLFISIMLALAYLDKRLSLMRWLFWLFLLMVLASIATALLYPSLGINIKDFGKARWIGVTTHPNALGVLGMLLIWLSLNIAYATASKFERLLTKLAIVAGFYVILKADSMTSLIAAFFVCSYIYYNYSFAKLSPLIKAMLIFGVVISCIFALAYMGAKELADTAMASSGRNLTFSGRSTLWSRGLESFWDSPIIGYGFDDLLMLTKKYKILMSHLHNGYIEILVKGGLIAELMLLFIVFKTYIAQLKIKPQDKSMFVFLNSGFIMVLIHNCTESSLMKGMMPLCVVALFLIVATTIAINRLNNRNELARISIVGHKYSLGNV